MTFKTLSALTTVSIIALASLTYAGSGEGNREARSGEHGSNCVERGMENHNGTDRDGKGMGEKGEGAHANDMDREGSGHDRDAAGKVESAGHDGDAKQGESNEANHNEGNDREGSNHDRDAAGKIEGQGHEQNGDQNHLNCN